MSHVSPQEKKKLAAFAAKTKFDPLLYAEYAWPWGKEGTPLEHEDIRSWQAEVFDEIAKHLQNPDTRYTPLRIAVSSGHGIGKSAGMGMLTSWALSCFRDPRIVITANTEGQLRTKTSPEVGQWVRSAITAPLFDVDTMSIRLLEAPEQHRADFSPWSENNTEAFQGLHAKGRIVMVLMDEGSAIADKVWEVIEGALTDADTVLIWIVFGNPTRNTGRFRECFRKYRRYWKTWQIDSRDVEGTNKEYLNSVIEQYGEDSDQARIRVKGMFPRSSSRQFISTELVDAAYGRHLREEQYSFAAKILTCDPAWTGDDELVIGLRQGLRFDILEVMERNDNDVFIATKLAHLEAQHNADAVFIDAGYGTGIYSAGITMGRSWQLVWFGADPVDVGCFNKRAEMWRDMRNWLMAGGAIPRDMTLYEDLIGPETKPHVEGKVQLESKEDMKKRLLNSPNRADALALSFAYPVQPKAMSNSTVLPEQRPVVRNEQFDPHADL